jgi:hypothetical protein
MATCKLSRGPLLRFGRAWGEVWFWIALPLLNGCGTGAARVLVTVVLLPASLCVSAAHLHLRDDLEVDLDRRTYRRRYGFLGLKTEEGSLKEVKRLRVAKYRRGFGCFFEELWGIFLDWAEPDRTPYCLAEWPLDSPSGLLKLRDNRWSALEELWRLSERLGVPMLDPFDEAEGGPVEERTFPGSRPPRPDRAPEIKGPECA